jgi:hypothetical protein
VLQNIGSALGNLILMFNSRKPTCFGELAKKGLQAKLHGCWCVWEKEN